MPEYLAPGVYIEEFEIGARPIEGVSTSTAGFLGETERGQTTPRLVTSWFEYLRRFGGFFAPNKYLPFAVKGFFDNGGQRCFIGRIVRATATDDADNGQKASEELNSTLRVEAIGEGAWGNRVGIIVEEGADNTTETPLFRLRIYYWKKLPDNFTFIDPDHEDNLRKTPRPSDSELFDNISIDEDSPDYFETKVNGISNFIKLSKQGNDDLQLPAPAPIKPLIDGSDGETGDIDVFDYVRSNTDKPGQRKGLTAFKEIDEISIVYSPFENKISGLRGEIITHCELLKDRFAILDADIGLADVANIDPRTDRPTQYAAFYYPWIKIIDPLSGQLKPVPPGGFVAGIYARTDTERGVHKAPANEVVRGAKELEFALTKQNQDILNPRGVNAIRAFPGRGIRVWGARTLSANTLWKYINVRRLFIFIEESIEKGTQWVVFEPNDHRLWARVTATITAFLTTQWREGRLMGTKPEEAFFVKCDRSTMTDDDIVNGRLICVIGIAPVRPAEFVIFRIAQLTGSATAAG